MFVDITRLAYGAMLRFPRSRAFLIDIGRCSLGIYCFTSYLNPALGAFAASLGPNPLVVGAEVVAMVALGLAATRVVSRSGLLSYFLLGGARDPLADPANRAWRRDVFALDELVLIGDILYRL